MDMSQAKQYGKRIYMYDVLSREMTKVGSIYSISRAKVYVYIYDSFSLPTFTISTSTVLQ